MEYVQLGSTGIKVSPLCLGTMTFGGQTDESEARLIVDYCRDLGINFIDCANVYNMGAAEEILGKLIADFRHDLVLTSKVGMRHDDGINQSRPSRLAIMTQAERSLKRLGTDYLDLYFIHRFDPDVPMEETLEALQNLVLQGKILHIGVSNWAAWQAAKALGIAWAKGLPRIACLQPMYNLVKRQAEAEILTLARAENLGVVTYSPLGGGLLTGKYLDDSYSGGRLREHPTYVKRYAPEGYMQTTKAIVEFCKERGFDPVTAAVAWVASHPAVTAPIVGGRSLEQFKPSLAALDFEMTPELRSELTALTPVMPIATDRLEETS